MAVSTLSLVCQHDAAELCADPDCTGEHDALELEGGDITGELVAQLGDDADAWNDQDAREYAHLLALRARARWSALWGRLRAWLGRWRRRALATRSLWLAAWRAGLTWLALGLGLDGPRRPRARGRRWEGRKVRDADPGALQGVDQHGFADGVDVGAGRCCGL